MANYRVVRVCRGDGKGYIEVLADGEQAERLYASATAANHREIPCMVYETGRRTAEERAFVIAVPLLDATELSVRLFDAVAPSARPVLEYTFSPLCTKIRSNLGYRFNRRQAESIRDVDQRLLSGQPYLYVAGMYPAGADEVVCRFHMTAPYDSEARYSIAVLDAAAEPIGRDLLVMEDCVVPDQRDSKNRLREMTFSVRLRASDTTVCITATHEGASTAFDGCFTCLLPANVDGFLSGARSKLSHASQEGGYMQWLETHRSTVADVLRQREIIKEWTFQPLISVVTPVYRTPAPFLQEMIQSVLEQSYGRFELILVNASGNCPEVDQVLGGYDDPRIRVLTIPNGTIASNTNRGIKEAKGDYIAFVDHDDIIEPDALYRYVSALQDDRTIDVMYCDEDHLKDGRYEWPVFKPAFNPDLLMGYNYITHMLMVSRHALDQVELSDDAVSGAQDYDLTLKCVSVARAVRNIPYVLYHWREHANSTSTGMDKKPYAITAGKIALQRYLDGLGVPAKVVERDDPCTYKVVYAPKTLPKISIVIPTKDHIDLLSACLESLLDITEYDRGRYEVICVENNSTEPGTFAYYEAIQSKYDNVRVVTWPGKGFNYSAICNYGAEQATGDLLLFLNNDTEIRDAGWLASMAGFFARKDVGVVGAKLLNHDGLVQHGGIWVAPGGCFYMNQNFTEHDEGYMKLLRLPSDVAAVTGACQMIGRRVFDEVGGFDESLVVSYSDVDLCLKAEETGYRTVFDADAVLYHRESSSRGRDDLDVVKRRRLEQEQFRFYQKWAGFERGRYININLNQYDGYFKIAR